VSSITRRRPRKAEGNERHLGKRALLAGSLTIAAMNRRGARGLLVIGVVVVVLNAYLLAALYGPLASRDGPMYEPPPGVFPVILVPILAFAASLFGLWRMWRVWRRLD
jgi:hypothetical protein